MLVKWQEILVFLHLSYKRQAVANLICNYLWLSFLQTINMRFSLAALALAATFLISGSQAITASSIEECPPLKPRSSPATKANDLRPDDIKVVAALGDRYK